MPDMSSDPVNVPVEILNSASKKAVPNKLVKVKGQKFRLSPTVKQLESECKRIHYLWKSSGAPGPEHPLSVQRKQAKYGVRGQIRKEFACARDAFYTELMENPTSKLFYRLIRRNQSAENKYSVMLKVNDEEISEAGQQCRAFAVYFEDLAMPKRHPDVDQCYLDLTLHQLDLIQELTEC